MRCWLQELEEVWELLSSEGSTAAAQRAQQLRWQERLALTQPQLGAREPMLALRRQLAELTQVSSAARLCALARCCCGLCCCAAAAGAAILPQAD